MSSYLFDVVVIGAGAVGLAIAENLSKIYKNVALIEKEAQFGLHASSRNSEVIHSGIYYPTNSLKNKLCLDGNKLIYKFLEKYGIDYKNCGKLIVSNNSLDDVKLEKLFNFGKTKKTLSLSLLESKEAKSIEPNVKCSRAIWVKSSGIMDSHKFMQRLEYNFKTNGGAVVYNTFAENLEYKNFEYIITTFKDEVIRTKILINAAGLWSDKFAKLLNLSNHRIHFCKGDYYKTNRYKNLSCLIYPIPSEISLGIHAVLQLNGDISFGPSAYYVDEIDYKTDESQKESFVKSIDNYLDIKESDIWPDYSGIRPKIQAKGESFKDFYIKNEVQRGFKNFINLIGIDSPGLTSSLAIANHVRGLIL